MFSFAGIVALAFFIFVRPQELFPALQQVPLIYIFFGLAVFGMVIDWRLRLLQPQTSPQLPWVVLFFLFSIVTAVLKAKNAIDVIQMIAILLVWYYLISHGLAGMRVYRAMTVMLLIFAVYLAAVAVHQGLSDNGCVAIDGYYEGLPDTTGVADGRPCQKTTDCYTNDAEPGKEYLCEHVGMLGTSSITQRVRYIGIFQDPNDLALTIAVALPFLVPLVRQRRSLGRLALAAASAGLIAICVYMSKSRGGLLVMATVLAVYFVRRYGIGGLLGGLAGGALLMLRAAAGRGEEAEGSTADRVEHMYEGMRMFRGTPIIGVGADQFTEHHFRTAHNSYVLTLAEVGLVGSYFWFASLYLTVKIPLSAYLRYREDPERRDVTDWALALLAAIIGTLVGIFFLSFTWHYMLWCYKAMAGAFYRAVKLHDPEWTVRCGARDLLAIGALLLLAAVGLYVLSGLLMARYV